MQRLGPLDRLLCAGCGLHLVSLGASSFIEEEHQTWYFLTTSLWLALLWADLRRWRRSAGPPAGRVWLCAGQLLLCGLLRRWNQTGDKWLHLPDIGDWLTAGERRLWLAGVWSAALLLLTGLLSAGGGGGWAAAGALCLLLRALCDARLLGPARLPAPLGLWAARAVYLLVLAGALWPVRPAGGAGGRLGRLRRAWLLLGALLVRPHNLPVWAGCALQSETLLAWLDALPRRSPLTAALMAHGTGMAAFFYMVSRSLPDRELAGGLGPEQTSFGQSLILKNQ